MRPIRRHRHLAAVLAALLLLAACSGGDDGESLDTSGTDTTAAGTGADDDTAGSDDDTAASDDSPDDVGAAGDPAPGDGGSAAPAPDGGEPAPAGGGGSSESGGTGDRADQGSDTPAAPARPIVARSGTYTYERTTTNQEGTETETSDSVVERLSGDDRAGRVRLTTESPQGKVTSEAEVSDAGTIVDRSDIESPLGEIKCDWEPDWTLYGPFTEGSTWTFDSACSDTATGLEVDVAVSGSGRVIGVEQVESNGATITAWLLETTTVTDFTVTSPTVNGSQSSEAVSKIWIDPELGMTVRNETENDSSGDFQTGTSSVVSVLTGVALT